MEEACRGGIRWLFLREELVVVVVVVMVVVVVGDSGGHISEEEENVEGEARLRGGEIAEWSRRRDDR